jgi:hypothetical protein
MGKDWGKAIIVGLVIFVVASMTGITGKIFGTQAIEPYITYPCGDEYLFISPETTCLSDEDCINDQKCMVKKVCTGTSTPCTKDGDCTGGNTCETLNGKICMQPACRTTVSCVNDTDCPKCFGRTIGKFFLDDTATREEVTFPGELAYGECATDPQLPGQNICYVSEYCIDTGKVKEWMNEPGNPGAWLKANPMYALLILAFVIFLAYAYIIER